MIERKKNHSGIDVYFDQAEQTDKKSRLEHVEAIDFYQFAIKRWPQIETLFCHIANESDSMPQYRSKLKQMGVSSGVSDYQLLIPNEKYNYLVIELKRANKKDGAASKSQKEYILEVNKNGGYGCICHGFCAALHVLELYLSNEL